MEHSIEKAVILSDNNELQPFDFLLDMADEKTSMMEAITLEDMERYLIEKALKKFNNNISSVASELGITRPTLYNKIKRWTMTYPLVYYNMFKSIEYKLITYIILLIGCVVVSTFSL